jgi:hypothetical protein
MSWFGRHLNWSLLLGLIYIPINVSFTVGLIAAIIIFSIAFFQSGASFNILALMAMLLAAERMAQQVQTILSIISLVGIAVMVIILTVWFLDRKGKSKAFVLLFPIVWAIGVVGFLNLDSGFSVFFIYGFIIGNILTLILLLLLGNEHAAVEAELLSNRLDMEPYGGYDDRQFNELDYTPTRNVLDIADSGDIKDIGVTREVTGIGGVGAAGVAGEEAPAQEEATEKAVSRQKLNMPILLDDTGAAISCFYHPGADAINLCSRCKQYVCIECNYITGTYPICRHCWDKRGQSPIAPPSKKPESQASGKPLKQKVTELDQAEQQKNEEPVEPEQQKGEESGKLKKQKIAVPWRSAKSETEKIEWQPEFMALYEQASPIISVITRKGPDGTLASPLDLMEGLKLRPILERVKRLSKPKDKELREAKSDFEQVLSGCIKIADAAADFVSSGGQALLGGKDFARIAGGIETASGLMDKLSQRLASFSPPQQ